MNDEQFAAATAGLSEHRDVQARQVSNGFALTGNRRFLVPSTGAVQVAVTVEAIAMDGAGAGAAVVAFLSSGSFTG